MTLSDLPPIDPDRPILIAGPTASGKSDLALHLAETQGGVIVNADASQVYDCWRVITARPSAADEARAPHHLYGHIPWEQTYSAGHWVREVTPMLRAAERPIIVGGTGLYFAALTEGMAEIPETPAELRAEADGLTVDRMLTDLDPDTRARIDTNNRARVQRAWEVQTATGRSLTNWQRATPPPVLAPDAATCLLLDAPKDWLEPRIRRRFDAMLAAGALQEVEAMMDHYTPTLPAFRAIGVPELVAVKRGEMTVDQAREKVSIATRQFAKRQRTWFRARMRSWHPVRLGP